jgi:ABC-type transport system involved in multi-copper enzyme maturation permease subunit
MTQTCAIFLEAYRNLNSKRLFWITLVLSGIVVALFACVGVNEHGMKFLFWQWDNDVLNSTSVPPDQFYKGLFVNIGIAVWLAWIALILALISTAGMFPDLMTAGSIDLFVSKPIGRLRLFVTEYLAGLLFAALQVTVFSVACFLVIGLRGGVWEPGLFLAVPLVVCVFSYLFSVCVFFGVTTRSTVAALLLTLAFWFVIWGMSTAESTLLMFERMEKHGTSMTAVQMEQSANMTRAHGHRVGPAAPADKKPEEEKAADESSVLSVAHNVAYDIKTVLPKTAETVELLERSLMKAAKLPEQPGGPAQRRMRAAQQEMVDILRGRSIAWVVGTSLGFEGVVLCFAALIFCRRDY